MLRIHLSRALLAALAVAALASGGSLVTSGVAGAAPRIDPGFGRGPPRIDPGFGNGPARVDPGFNRDSGPQYSLKKRHVFHERSNCHWVRSGLHYRPGSPDKIRVCY